MATFWNMMLSLEHDDPEDRLFNEFLYNIAYNDFLVEEDHDMDELEHFINSFDDYEEMEPNGYYNYHEELWA